MFDEALRETRMPTADDLEISFPVRREPKKEPSGEPAGEHGGAAGGEATGDAHSDAANSAEPVPQRDEPDEGEHTDSTEAQIAARAAREAPEEPQDAVDDPEVPDDPSEPQEEAPDASERTRKQNPRPLVDVLVDTPGTHPLAYSRVAFSAGAGVETLSLTRFPQPLVDELRMRLAPTTGGSFAEQISATSIITAFLAASLGVKLDLDDNSSNAADAFRRDHPRMAGIEDKLDETLDNIDQLASVMKIALERIGGTGQIVDGLEFAMAYLVADRVASVTTSETTEHNVDVTQKKVLVTRDRIKSLVKEQRTIEKQREWSRT